MQRRRLGQLEVSAIGLGCGTMTPFYGEPDRAAQAIVRQHRRGEHDDDLVRRAARIRELPLTRVVEPGPRPDDDP